MRLGITNKTLGVEHFSEACRLAAAAGADGIELGYNSAATAGTLYETDLPQQLRSEADLAGVEIAGLALNFLCERPSLIGKPDQSAESLELIQQALAVASEAGAGLLAVPFFGKNAIEIDKEFTQAADSLLELVDHAEHAHVVIAVVSTLNFGQQQFLRDHLGGSEFVKIYVDPAAATARKLDLPTGIRDINSDAIGQVYLRDVKLHGGQPPDYNVALGEGDVDFAAAVAALQAVGFDGWVVIDAPYSPDSQASPEASVRMAKSILGR